MNAVRKFDETARERLQRVASLSPPFERRTLGANSLLAIGLLLLIGAILMAAIVGGILGQDIVSEYVRRIREWAWPQ